jgi:hypothetical protein
VAIPGLSLRQTDLANTKDSEYFKEPHKSTLFKKGKQQRQKKRKAASTESQDVHLSNDLSAGGAGEHKKRILQFGMQHSWHRQHSAAPAATPQHSCWPVLFPCCCAPGC